MPKMKTKKSLLRRVKVTASGKILHASNFKRHLRRSKSKSQLRRLKGTKEFTPGYANKIRKALGI
ncbi:MAG TPA: 50S ribosomal protein L35 [Patescibacteria group bacterium]|nr:50S ribosomal protein L35 [Patescibacteria group bacterium]